MGAVASCLSQVVSAIGRGIMAVLNGIVSIIGSIIAGIETILVATFNCIADVICCRCGGSSGSTGRMRKSRMSGRKRI